MSIVNYDYKLKAKILPYQDRIFHYSIFANITFEDGESMNYLAYEGISDLSSLNNSYESRCPVSIKKAFSLAKPKMKLLPASAKVNYYYADSPDSFIHITTQEDGKGDIDAWCSEENTEAIAVETQWIIGNQIDTSIQGSEETARILSPTYLKSMIRQNTEQILPDQFEVVHVEMITNNQKVVAYQEVGSGKIMIYGIDISIQNIVKSANEDQVVIMPKGSKRSIYFSIETDSDQGINPSEINYLFDREGIVEVVDGSASHAVLHSIKEGQVDLKIMYAGVDIARLSIESQQASPQINVSISDEKVFVGQSFTLHIGTYYDNGDQVKIKDIVLETYDAHVEKIEGNHTYLITPVKSGVANIDITLIEESGVRVQTTFKTPVYNKELYRFHIGGRASQVIKDEVIKFEALYLQENLSMQHNDQDIKWSIPEGEENGFLKNNQGKEVYFQGSKSGKVSIRASVYDHEDTIEIDVIGEKEPYLTLSNDSLYVPINGSKLLSAVILNSDNAEVVEWHVTSGGRIKWTINKNQILIEGVIAGDAKLWARYKNQYVECLIRVSEIDMQSNHIEMMSDTDTVYIPTEDSPEQWKDIRFENPYKETKGMLTSSQGRASGTEDNLYAFKSGIGDNDDLLVKQPMSENDIQSFQYAARLRGTKEHRIMIYPEITFQYSVQYKGDLYETYNETIFEVDIDAYPAKVFDFNIKEDRKLETERDYQVEMQISGTVGKKELEYAVSWQASAQVKDEGDVKDLFVSGGTKGDYIGSGTALSWRLGNGFVYDTYNLSRFSGVVAKKYYGYASFEAEFDYKPIPGDSSGVPDDDLIGLIFKAKDTKNFYVMLIEGQERVRESNRTGDNLEGFDIYNDSPDDWNNRSVKTNPYLANSTLWRIFETTTGWKTQHRRIYKVTNGKMSRVAANDLAGGNGWNFNSMQSMKVRCIGKNVDLYVRHSTSGDFTKVFSLTTDWAEGSFGMMNISQAVQFHGIRVKEWKELKGRIPESGYDKYDGIGPKTLSSSGKEYVKAKVIAQLTTPSQPYEITQVSGETNNSSAGTVTVSVTAPLIVKTNNPANAGQPVEAKFIKQGKAKITPDNNTLNTAASVYTNAKDFFKTEIAKFKTDHPELGSATIEPVFKLLAPSTSEKEFDFTQERLLFWKEEAPIETTSKDYSYIIYAYEGWKEAKGLSEFKGGKWATYTLTFKPNPGTVNAKYDAWKWKNSGDKTVHNDPTDVLSIKTTEWYQGTFPADIKNTGKVNSDVNSYVDIPPNHEHYIEPYEKTPMPGIFSNVHYLLHKQPVGKQSFVWMYWESAPAITTRNTNLQSNILTGQYIIKTDRQNDRVVVVCDIDPRYIPWISGKYLGIGKVNGKRPFFGESSGKANMINVPTDVVFLPKNLVNIEGPFVNSEDDRVKVSIDAGNKTAMFDSDFKDNYVWHTDWYTDWVKDERGFYAKMDEVMRINDPISINANDQLDYSASVTIEKAEVISDNPFVSVWTEQASSEDTGLLATYYKYPQETENIVDKFVVGGNFQIKEQVLIVEEAITGVNREGFPITEGFVAGSEPLRGNIAPLTEEQVSTVYVPAGQAMLRVVSSFMVNTANKYPDMLVIAPNGESFGVKYMNGTWSESSMTKSNLLSCHQYKYDGDNGSFEVMTFTVPIEGMWKIKAFNQGNQNSDYVISTNISTAARNTILLKYIPDPNSVSIKVNGTTISAFTMNGKELIISAPLVNEDIIAVSYKAGGAKINDLPIQSRFTLADPTPLMILKVTKNDIAIPKSNTNGYTVDGQQFQLHGGYITSGTYIVKYGIGEINNAFTLTKELGLTPEVYLNGEKLDTTKYSLDSNKLIVDRSMLLPKDWIHVQSYKVTKVFDPQKSNYLGDYMMTRIDPFINFDWGMQSPFDEMTGKEVAKNTFSMMDVITDTVDFNMNVDMEISYPSAEVIDTSNFTGTWAKFDENIGSDVGDWHGPPESGYDKVTNLANQSYRSGWYNPSHVTMTDYVFEFMVQEQASGDDDMYGAMFRFNPTTKNFYSFEWDAGGMDTKGMAIYRNICINPSQYGIVTLTYNKIKLAHIPEKWSFGTSQINKIKIRVVGNNIKAYTNDILKLEYTDSSPDALTAGAWGPITMSQPKTYFWEFTVSKMLKENIRKAIHSTGTKPFSDTVRTQEMIVKNETLDELFNSELSAFLTSKSLAKNTVELQFTIKNDTSSYPAHFTGGSISTNDSSKKIESTVLTKPTNVPQKADWMDYREINRDYIEQDSAIDSYSPDLPEPYIDPIQVTDKGTMEDGFSASWKGSIFAPVSGVYTFYSNSDDGFRLWINKKKLIDRWVDQVGGAATASITLEGGKWYDITAHYYENQGAANVKLEWSHPEQTRSVITSDYLSPQLGFKVLAKVKQATPLPWSPMIHNGYYYFNENEYFLYAGKVRHVKTPINNEILIQPRPEQGTAIIVRDNQGNNLRKTSFYQEYYNDNGELVDYKQTLIHKEQFIGSGYSKYYLQYKDIDDLSVVVYLNGKQLNADQYILDSHKASIELIGQLMPEDVMDIQYCLMYSYYIDYNHDANNGVSKVVLHSRYDESKMKDMEIIYEGDRFSSFYRAEEISLNPILTHNHKGFLYLTNKENDITKGVEINVSPKTLSSDGLGKVLVTGSITDKYNNPIQNKKVSIYRDGILLYEGETNRAGEVYLYDQPVATTEMISRYQITCDSLSNQALLNYFVPNLSKRSYIEMKVSKPVLMAGQEDYSTIYMTLRNEKWESISSQVIIVSYTDTMGETITRRLTTNIYGEASLTLTGADQQQGSFVVNASYDMGSEYASTFIYLKVIGA